MARANLNKSKKVFTSTTTTQYASPYTRGPESVLIEMAFSQILAIRSEQFLAQKGGGINAMNTKRLEIGFKSTTTDLSNFEK